MTTACMEALDRQSNSGAPGAPSCWSPQRVFLVGSPRSGTTLLQCLLAAHSRVWSLPETGYFAQLSPMRRGLDLLGLASRQQHEQYLRLLELCGHHAPGVRYRLPASTRQYGRAFVRLMDRCSLERGCPMWVEKTPYHVRRIALITRLVPDAQFVHIVRNGADAIASVYDAAVRYSAAKFGDPADLDSMIAEWRRNARHTLRYAGEPGHYIVRYTRLADAPETTLQALCRWLRLPYESTMLERYASALDRVRSSDEPWKDGVAEPIRNRDGSKFESVFTPEQQRAVLAGAAGVDLSRLDLLD